MTTGISTPQKVWKSGNAKAISIPKKIAEMMNYKEGDYIVITWGEKIENMETKKVPIKEENKEEKERLPFL